LEGLFTDAEDHHRYTDKVIATQQRCHEN